MVTNGLKKSAVAGIFIGAVLAGCSVESQISDSNTSADILRAKILENRPAPLTNLAVKVSLNVKNFGAVPNDGNDDGAAIRAAIQSAKSMEGPVKIDFDPGSYDFFAVPSEFSPETEGAVLDLQNCANLIVDGNGAEILIHRQDISFARVGISTNLIVRNFTVDYDPLPFSQGTVEKVNAAAASFVMKLHPGFPQPDDPSSEKNSP